MKSFTAFLSGLIFGLGLIIAGMANQAKVLGFLDLAGAWNPSLAFVMIGAIGVGLIVFSIAARRPVTLFGAPIQLPKKNAIDKKLVGGSLIFGVGWGLAGICPGPAFVLLGAGESNAVIFVATLLFGLFIANRLGSQQKNSGE